MNCGRQSLRTSLGGCAHALPQHTREGRIASAVIDTAQCGALRLQAEGMLLGWLLVLSYLAPSYSSHV